MGIHPDSPRSEFALAERIANAKPTAGYPSMGELIEGFE
jgi:hypothetical protein